MTKLNQEIWVAFIINVACLNGEVYDQACGMLYESFKELRGLSNETGFYVAAQ